MLAIATIHYFLLYFNENYLTLVLNDELSIFFSTLNW